MPSCEHSTLLQLPSRIMVVRKNQSLSVPLTLSLSTLSPSPSLYTLSPSPSFTLSHSWQSSLSQPSGVGLKLRLIILLFLGKAVSYLMATFLGSLRAPVANQSKSKSQCLYLILLRWKAPLWVFFFPFFEGFVAAMSWKESFNWMKELKQSKLQKTLQGCQSKLVFQLIVWFGPSFFAASHHTLLFSFLKLKAK